MSDPLSEIVRLLRPQAAFANVITGKGQWSVRYSEYGLPSFCIVLGGRCRLAVDGHAPLVISEGDFVLLPATPAFTMSSVDTAPPVHLDPRTVASARREMRYGEKRGRPDMRALGGSFTFGCGDSSLLVSLLPRLVHVRDSARLSLLVRMVGEESAHQSPGTEFVVSRLVDLMLVEAIRSVSGPTAPPGLLRGLGDERLARVLTQVHAHVDRAWSVDALARIAALSRSAFFERFTRLVGMTPGAYLLAWRMEVAKSLLREGGVPVYDIAERVGYGSASAFSVAFSRHVGEPPSRHARRTSRSGVGNETG